MANRDDFNRNAEDPREVARIYGDDKEPRYSDEEINDMARHHEAGRAKTHPKTSNTMSTDEINKREAFKKYADKISNPVVKRPENWTKSQKEALEKLQQTPQPKLDQPLPDKGNNPEYDRVKDFRAATIEAINREIERNKGTLKRDFDRSRGR